MELKEIFLNKHRRGQFWMFGVCVYCAMMTCHFVFLCITTVSDKCCVFKINFYIPIL